MFHNFSSFMLVLFKLPGMASAAVFRTDLEKLYLLMHANSNSLACAKTPIKGWRELSINIEAYHKPISNWPLQRCYCTIPCRAIENQYHAIPYSHYTHTTIPRPHHTKKSIPWETFENWRKKLHKLGLIFPQNTVSFEKYFQTRSLHSYGGIPPNSKHVELR